MRFLSTQDLSGLLPVLPDDPALLKNKHFISVGSFKPWMQELPASVYRLAGHIVIDSVAAHHEVGDVARPLAKGLVKEADIFHIAELVLANRTIDPMRTTAYKCVGMAMYDLFVARAMLEAARERKSGQEINL